MPEPPQNLPATEAERLGVMTSRMPGGSYGGETRFALTGPFAGPAPERVPGYAEVDHFDDPDVPRPLAGKVQWRGAAEPNNAVKGDFWYPSNDFDDD